MCASEKVEMSKNLTMFGVKKILNIKKKKNYSCVAWHTAQQFTKFNWNLLTNFRGFMPTKRQTRKTQPSRGENAFFF